MLDLFILNYYITMTNNNGGLPQQQIPGGSVRQESVNSQTNATNKQLTLISPTGGKRRKTNKRKTNKRKTNKRKTNKRKTRRHKRRKIRGGAGSIGNSPSSISPPIVPNTGSTAETRNGQQGSYNNLASLSGSVNANSEYDLQKGGRRKRKGNPKSRKTKQHSKRRKYY
jgi:hypothetical protein